MKTCKHSLLPIPVRGGLVLALLALALGVAPVSVAQAAPLTSPGPVLSTSTEGPAELLQLTAGGHVLGFQPDGVYLVGGDHMLKATFDGATGVAPVTNQPPSTDNQAQPLGRVTYPHLWEGISLTYEQTAGGIAKSSYYRWLQREGEGRLEDRRGGSRLPWNRVRPEEAEKVLRLARSSPELSPRQVALTLTDSDDFYVSESTVYRILRREGLIKPAEVLQNARDGKSLEEMKRGIVMEEYSGWDGYGQMFALNIEGMYRLVQSNRRGNQ